MLLLLLSLDIIYHWMYLREYFRNLPYIDGDGGLVSSMGYNTVSVSGIGYRGSDRYSGVLSGGGHHGLAGGHGELVLDGSAVDLGDGVTVLNLDGNLDDLWVVHTVLSGDLTASMLHSSSDGVGHSMSNGGRSDCDGSSNSSRSNGSISSMTVRSSEVLGISLSVSLSLSFSLCLPLNMVVSGITDRSGSITQSVHNLLADLLILNLFSSHSLSAANLFSARSASLGDQDDILSDTVRSGSSVVGDGSHRSNGSMSIAKSLSISIS